ncbi:MAG: Rpn family recombination-promoting nuclease/putative transposase, partial [Planctomycetes bacterium]|nr:Rpn family recombination-promoting nuclease/putative transposase [Planctomycetota bacterium]
MRVLLGEPALFVQLVAVLDPELARRIDPVRLVRLERTFLDEAYRERETDLLYRAPFTEEEGELWIYCLLEHQSTVDPWMPLRFLHAMTSLWEEERRRRQTEKEEVRLTPIVPILVYTGGEPWDAPADLQGLLGAPFLADFAPRLDILRLDLARTNPADLERSEVPLAWVLGALREEKADPGSFAAALERNAEKVDGLPEERIVEWRLLVRFLLALVYQRRPLDEHRGLFESLGRRIKSRRRSEVEEMEGTLGRTLPERAHQEGYEKGIEKGIEKGMLEGNLEALRTLLRASIG